MSVASTAVVFPCHNSSFSRFRDEYESRFADNVTFFVFLWRSLTIVFVDFKSKPLTAILSRWGYSILVLATLPCARDGEI